MLALLIPVLSAVLPGIISKVVNRAEVELPNAPGAEKKEWVMGLFTDIWDIVEVRVPSIQKYEDLFKNTILPHVSTIIEAEVSKMKQPKA